MGETGCPPCRCMICGNLVDKAAHADADRLRAALAASQSRERVMREALEKIADEAERGGLAVIDTIVKRSPISGMNKLFGSIAGIARRALAAVPHAGGEEGTP